MDEKPEINLLQKIWEKEFNERTAEAEERLEFVYGVDDAEMQQKGLIASAMAFWQTFHELGWRGNRQWMKAYLCSENPLITTIAMIELLPTIVWRRILWRYNIDFQSLESFLRRLKPEQHEAICANYFDLENGRIPRAFSKWEIFTRKLTVEKLRSGMPHHCADHFDSKSAWSYNIKPFDFGFNAYPNGAKDDKSEFCFSTKKFLSSKSHDNDFVVDKEFGNYWWMYRKARSNFGFRPDAHVSMKRQVCPGFWLTMLMHLWFWVVSPILAITLIAINPPLQAVIAKPLLYSWVPLAFLTPLWLMRAGIRLVFMGIKWLFDDLLGEKITRAFKIGLTSLWYMLIFSMLGSATFNAYKHLLPTLGKIHTSLLLLLPWTSYALLRYAVFMKDRNETMDKEVLHSWYAQVVITAAAFLVTFYHPIYRIIFKILSWLAHWLLVIAAHLITTIMAIGAFWLLLLVPVGFLALTIYLSRLPADRQEKGYALIDRATPWAFAAYLMLLAGAAFAYLGTGACVFILVVGLASWFGSMHFVRKSDPIWEQSQALNQLMLKKGLISDECQLSYLAFRQNPSLRRKSQENQLSLLAQATELTHRIFGHGNKHTQYIFDQLVMKLDHRVTGRFHAKTFRQFSELESRAERCQVFFLILDRPDLDFNDALQMVRGGVDPYAERWNKEHPILHKLTEPITALGRNAQRIAMAVVNLFRELKVLKDAFDKRCPFTERSRNIAR